MENRIGNSAIVVLVLVITSVSAQRYSRVLDCLGTQVSKDADSTVYSGMRPWIDTVQDTAHFLGFVEGCDPPTCNPIFSNCNPNPGCKIYWIEAAIDADLVNDRISTLERHKIYDTWAADLNASFKLKVLFPSFIEDSVPVTVDSSTHYAIWPFPWLTKGDILALSKKCYINKIEFPYQPVVNRGSHSIPIYPKGGKAFNGKGQKMGDAKSGVYYLRPKP